jgi:uncharacterized protein (TIGR03435 family)
MLKYENFLTALQIVAIVAVGSCVMNPVVLAQSRDGIPAPIVFDAASIRPVGPGIMDQRHTGGPDTDSPTLYRQTKATISDMIRVAWNVKPNQVVSAIPIDSDSFDVVARIPEGATRNQFREMLRNLLAERFSLKAHVETREFSGYELVISKTGLKVKESPTETTSPADAAPGVPNEKADWHTLKPGVPGLHESISTQGGLGLARCQVQLQTFGTIARMLEISRSIGSPVVNHTGLTGKYTFSLEYTEDIPGMTPDGPPAAPDIFDALRSQVGVELVKGKFPLPLVVVDSVNRTPTDN